VELVDLDAKKRQYPYSKNRVFLSVIIAALSTFLALTLLLSDLNSVLTYFFSTFIFAAITFFLKKRLYSYLITDDTQVENENERKSAPWKMLLITFLMLIGFIAIPMLLAGFVTGVIWFIVVTSFTSGVSISEIILYIQATSNR
jgi:hypothetical protein